MKFLAYMILLSTFLHACNLTVKQNNALSKNAGSVETKLVSGGRIWSMDWSPDDKYIACGNASGLLRIYDAEKLELVDILTGFKSTINGINWSPDGKKIVASGPHEDPRVIIWDLEEKSRIIIDAHKRQVRSVKWSPEGTYVASTSHDGTIRIWTPSGEFVKMFTGANMGCVGIDWLNEDKLVASCWDNTIRIYTISGKDSLLIENGNHRRKAVLAVDWHPYGELFATGEYGNSEDSIHAVKIWTKDGQLVTAMQSHEKEIRSLAWNKSGDLLATGGETVRLWNKDGNLLNIFKENNSPIWSLDWNAEGTKVASGHNDGKIRIWNTKGELLNLLDGHSSEKSALSFDKDSSLVILGFADGTLRSFNLNNLACRTIPAHSRSITNIVWSQDQKYIALSSNDGTCSIWNILNGVLVDKGVYFGNGLYTKSIAWSEDNKSIAYLHNEHDVSVFSVNGEFEYSSKIDANNFNSVGWKEGKPVGIQSSKKPFEFKDKVVVRKEQKIVELIPLNNNHFALIDSLNHIVHGDKNDFVLVLESVPGFVNLKKLE